MKILFYFFAFLVNIHVLHSSAINLTSVAALRTPPPNTVGALSYASPIGEDIGITFIGSGFTQVKYIVFELNESSGSNRKITLELEAPITNDVQFNINVSNQEITTAGTYNVYLQEDQYNSSNSQQYIFFDIPTSQLTTNTYTDGDVTLFGNYFIEVSNFLINNQPAAYSISAPNEINFQAGPGNTKITITNTKGTASFQINIPLVNYQSALALATKQTDILISGFNLNATTNVYFGSIAVPFQIVSDNLIIAQSPLISDIAKKLEIPVENAEGLSLVEPKPTIYIIQPYLFRKLNQYFKLNKINHIR